MSWFSQCKYLFFRPFRNKFLFLKNLYFCQKSITVICSSFIGKLTNWLKLLPLTCSLHCHYKNHWIFEVQNFSLQAQNKESIVSWRSYPLCFEKGYFWLATCLTHLCNCNVSINFLTLYTKIKYNSSYPRGGAGLKIKSVEQRKWLTLLKKNSGILGPAYFRALPVGWSHLLHCI